LKQDSPIIIGGDGRADSPDHSEKFGSYGILDNKVLHIELVQVSKKVTYPTVYTAMNYLFLE